MAATLAGVWTDLESGIRVRQSKLFWMNSVVLAHAEHTILVDPGVLPSELDDLASQVRKVSPREITLVLSHGHWDHVLGRPWWPGAATLAHDRFATEVREREDHIVRSTVEAVANAGERWERGFEPFRPTHEVSGLHFMKLGPWRVVFRDAPGHCASMLSLHLPEHRVLFAADMLSDIEIPILAQPIEVYRQTLLELAPLAENGAIETLIPGHGAIARGRDAVRTRLERDLRYLDQLEHSVRAARDEGLTLERATERLEAMDYVGKNDAYSMVENHRNNIRLAYQEAGATAAHRTRSRPR